MWKGRRRKAGPPATKAHLKFTDSAGAEIGIGVSRACSLDSTGDMFDLVPGGNGVCVLALLEQNGKYMVPWKRRQRAWDGDFLVDENIDFDALPHRVEVSLLDANDQLLLPPLIVEIASPNGKPQVTIIGKLQGTINPHS